MSFRERVCGLWERRNDLSSSGDESLCLPWLLATVGAVNFHLEKEMRKRKKNIQYKLGLLRNTGILAFRNIELQSCSFHLMAFPSLSAS